MLFAFVKSISVNIRRLSHLSIAPAFIAVTTLIKHLLNKAAFFPTKAVVEDHPSFVLVILSELIFLQPLLCLLLEQRMPRQKHRQSPSKHRYYLREALAMVLHST